MEIDRQQSEFNMAVSYLNRLNALFYKADEAAIELDVYTWFHCLLALFRELSTEMKDTEIKEWEKEQEIINQHISKYINEKQRNGMGKVTPELYRKLHKFELFLRYILEKAGLQKKMMDDAMNALK